MDGPGIMSSDILGIELGRRVIRGVRLDQYRAELTAVAECELFREGLSAEGIIDVSVVGPVLEDLLTRLKVTDRSRVRIGFSVGPRNSGVGSGPAMAGWLEQQAKNLRENMQCAGGLGVAFVPSRAVDAAIKLSRDGGIDLARLDLAPVAAARAIGTQVDDRICLGSGHGWQARMRDLEVLEAKENLHVGFDDPMTLVDTKGYPRSIERYGWVEMSPGLEQAGGMNMAQMAVAVGVAIGIAYSSPADLLQSKLVPGEPDESTVDPALAHLVGLEVSPEATLRLQPPAKPQLPQHTSARRTARETPEASHAAVRASTTQDIVDAVLVTEAELGSTDQETAVDDGAVALEAGTIEPQLVVELDQLDAGPEPTFAPDLEPELRQQLELQAELQRQSEPGFEVEYEQQLEADAAQEHNVDFDRHDAYEDDRGGQDVQQSRADGGDSELIDMFSPDTEVDHMMGRRERRLTVDIAIALMVVAAVAAAIYFFVL
jgi:hypothetical protein